METRSIVCHSVCDGTPQLCCGKGPGCECASESAALCDLSDDDLSRVTANVRTKNHDLQDNLHLLLYMLLTHANGVISVSADELTQMQAERSGQFVETIVRPGNILLIRLTPAPPTTCQGIPLQEVAAHDCTCYQLLLTP